MRELRKPKVEKLKFDDVAISLDDLTEQLRVANQMKAAEILHQQNAISTIEYVDFLGDIYRKN